MLKPIFYKRDYTLNTFQASWLAVKSATWDEIGGCDTAELAGWNLARVDLAQALGLLRCGVELVDESGIPCWWGYVEKIELFNGKHGAVCSLDEMSNRVKVDYILLDYQALDYRSIDQRAFYGWIDKTRSQEIYGVKEKIIRVQEATLEQATARAGVELAERAWPVARPGTKPSAEAGDLFITLKGWWHSTGWRYYDQAAGQLENYALVSGANQKLGQDSYSQWVAQSFMVGAVGWKLATVWVELTKIDHPEDGVKFILYDNVGGLPGGGLRTEVVVMNDDISWGYGWVAFHLATPYTLAPNTMYWLAFARTGDIDGVHYYRIRVDLDLKHAGGVFKYFDGEGWFSMPTEVDLVFRTSGNLQTTDQIALMAAAGCGGQFLAGVNIEKASGVYSNPYRRGDRTAQAEIIDLIKAGDSTAGRLLCEVTKERVLRVYSAPAASSAVLRVNVDGVLTDERGYPLAAWAPAAGQWAILENPWLGGGSPDNEISDRFYIKRVEYDAKSGFLRPARGVW